MVHVAAMGVKYLDIIINAIILKLVSALRETMNATI